MSSTRLTLEVLSPSTKLWVDYTSNLKLYKTITPTGMSSVVSNSPQIGQVQLILDNRSSTFNNSSNIDIGTRVKLKASGLSLKKCFQISRNGASGNNISGFQQLVTISGVATDIFTLSWQARAQYDSQYNSDRILIKADNVSDVTTTLFTYTNKWVTYTATLTLANTTTTVLIKFDCQLPTDTGSNTHQIEYKNITLKKNSGSNLLINGDFSSNPPSPLLPYNSNPQLLIDGDMEAVGTASWSSGTAVLSKQVTSPHSGKQVLRITSVAVGGFETSQAFQSILTIGNTYNIVGWARSDGTNVPRVKYNSTSWIGTTSTSWQQFVISFIATSTLITLYISTFNPTGAEYAEFDDFTVTEAISWTGYGLGPQLLVDGNMESAGVGAWTALQSVLSKQVTNPYSGTQCLRIAHNVTSDAYAGQSILSNGTNYTITGVARSNGTGVPLIYLNSGASVWSGTKSTIWQPFTASGVSDGSAAYLAGNNLGVGDYVEYDDVTIWQTNLSSLLNTNVINDYWIIFNGWIGDIDIDPFVLAGQYTSTLICYDLVDMLSRQLVDVPLQYNKTADQLVETVVSQLNNGSYNATILLDQPIGYWRMNALSGTSEVDLSGSLADGTYSGSVTYNVVGALIGDLDTAITFNGTNTQMSIPSSIFSPIISKPWSIDFWINVSSFPVSTKPIIFVSGGAGNDQAFTIGITSTGKINFAQIGEAANTSSSSLVIGSWTYVCIVNNLGSTTIYINTASVGTAGTNYLTVAPTSIYLGTDTVNFAAVSLDEVAFYLSSLSVIQLTRHYNAGLGKYNQVKIPGTLLSTGLQSFSVSFDGYTKETVSVLNASGQASLSEFSWFYVDRDGTIRLTNRTYVPSIINNSPKLIILDGMPVDMTPRKVGSYVSNYVIVTVHPRNILGGPVVVGQITSYQSIPPLQADNTPGKLTITLTFRDPTTQKLCGGDGMIIPVATTDYLVNDNPAGTGFNYTNTQWFKLGAVNISASQATITVYNYATGILYITKLQIRGNPVVTYDPLTLISYDPDSIENIQQRKLSIDLPFNNNSVLAKSLADYELNRFRNSFLEVQKLIIDNEVVINNIDILSLELLDVISISDVQSGLSSVKHVIIGISYIFSPQGNDQLVHAEFTLQRIDQLSYWILNDATYGVLGTTTRLFI